MPIRANELDDLDHRILEQLQRDCALTNQDLAEKVHASPPTCLRRVRRLVETGLIQQRVAILDPVLMGAALTVIIEVTLDTQAATQADALEAQLLAEPAIQQCYRVSSGPDFILIAMVADMPAYQALAQRCLTSDPRIRNVRSFFATARSKFTTRIPIAG
ncbi:MAG: Lrp/AsnC family transcriptional regulator [Castellaniella sp.]|uniref:Lrp/AsnC family transcriptional regulator n=1 Tax=Castellaniella sp. TaxID=1955812 RepID=UPI00122341C2|nr:Lrp/AsnC family transcriptional regulator [Castellaniella sp.]TAN28503.1 MAG: Lrp/AsnC family transcriptional regulator [Castellaniella sp.]